VGPDDRCASQWIACAALGDIWGEADLAWLIESSDAIE
jgi:hypothetical protein